MLPETSSQPSIGQPFIHLAQVDSTNNYAMGLAHEGLATHGTAIFANHQTSGKGQRGKTWNSSPGQNIILSLILQPLPGYSPFTLSALLAISCRKFVQHYAKSEVTVKWPNDIYWRDRKAGGILIENIFRNDKWQWCIAGMGININQVQFSPDLKNPVSLKQITGAEMDTADLARELCQTIDSNLRLLSPEQILQEYNSLLFKKGEQVRLRSSGGEFLTIIDHVTSDGILVTRDNSLERKFSTAEWDFPAGQLPP